LWSSYKATCQRDGVWNGWYGRRDFNAELCGPIDRKLAGKWERVFQRRIPHALRAFAEECKIALDSFHSAVATNLVGAGASLTRLRGLDQQKLAYQVTLDATPDLVIAKVTENQREANRGFTPVIQTAMKPGYDVCSNERGES
jgi:hypothetical protein